MRLKDMTDDDWMTVRAEISDAFSPGAPVEETELFAGRSGQISTLMDAVNQRGRHAILYGERGVGKTSLANILRLVVRRPNKDTVYVRVNADPTDTFQTLWLKVFKRMNYAAAADGSPASKISDELPANFSPDDVQLILQDFAEHQTPIIVLDEFDRIQDKVTTGLVADTIKALSDYSVGATVIVVGVAEDVSSLIEGHESITRSLIQVRMPRMSTEEMKQLVLTRYQRSGIATDEDTIWKIVFLSRGLPYYTHLLAMNAALTVIERRSLTVRHTDVDIALARSIAEMDQSTKEKYVLATRTQQSDTLYPSVLLACALASTDELGRFQQTSVAAPLNKLFPGKSYTASTFALHMNAFCGAARGSVLQKSGTTRNFRYRFSDPMMQPFVIFKGLHDGLLTDATAEIFSTRPQMEIPIEF